MNVLSSTNLFFGAPRRSVDRFYRIKKRHKSRKKRKKLYNEMVNGYAQPNYNYTHMYKLMSGKWIKCYFLCNGSYGGIIVRNENGFNKFLSSKSLLRPIK